jgi:methylated-DNA-[protein]-cysteine S-methyltransferase
MDTTYYAILTTPLKTMLAVTTDMALTGLWFCDSLPSFLAVSQSDGWIERPDHPLLVSLKEWLERYFLADNPPVNLPLQPSGSEFQLTVWNLLREIPHGSTKSYGQLAMELADLQQRERPPAAQAIGGAVGKNPLSLLIPCHRVVGANGQLTGYGGGLDRKAALLQLERSTSDT